MYPGLNLLLFLFSSRPVELREPMALCLESIWGSSQPFKYYLFPFSLYFQSLIPKRPMLKHLILSHVSDITSGPAEALKWVLLFDKTLPAK